MIDNKKFILAGGMFSPSHFAEFWLINGQLIDVSKYPRTHTGYVIRYLLDKNHVENPGQYMQDRYGMQKEDVQSLMRYNIPDDELQVILGNSEADDFAVRTMGWIRVSDDALHIPNIASSTLHKSADALLKIYGSGIQNKTFYIITPSEEFDDVRFEDIADGNTAALKNSGYMTYASTTKLIKLAAQYDRSGKFAKADKIDRVIVRLAVSGEFWLMGGQAMFADGDIGDVNHEGMVIDTILGSYDLDSIK